MILDNYWFWTSLSLILFTLEPLLGASFLFLLLGAASGFVSVCIVFNPGISFYSQTIIFFIFASVHFIFWYYVLRVKMFKSEEHDVSDYLGDSVGQTLVLTDDMVNHVGRVRFKGSWWQSYCKSCADIAIGTKVTIVKIEGNIINVEPLEG